MNKFVVKHVVTPRWQPLLHLSSRRLNFPTSQMHIGKEMFFSTWKAVFRRAFKATQCNRMPSSSKMKIAKSTYAVSQDLKKETNPFCDENYSHIIWWKEKMDACKKPSSVQLIKKLAYSNIMGLDATLKNGSLKEGTLNAEILELKSKFPREVLLCRVGDFYEALGFDACVLVEYAGLNPVGGISSGSIPRAGCPVVNLRQTLDDLTRSGYSVCIVEEIQGPTQARSRKGRFISGHAHPGCPYVFGLAGLDHDVDFPEPMPVIGISRSAKGYSLTSVLEPMKTFCTEDGLTEEALVAKLRASRFHCLFLHLSLRCNSSGTCRWGEYGEGGLLWGECRGKSFEWFDGAPVVELLHKVRQLHGLDCQAPFRCVSVFSDNRPRPLYLGTATQIGAIPTEGIPSLLNVLLPSNCNGLPVMYIRNLLLNPPPYATAFAIQEACRLMNSMTTSIPDFTCISAAKVVKLLETKETNHPEFLRIKSMVDEVLLMHSNPELLSILNELLEPTSLATGLKMDIDMLVSECRLVSEKIDEIIFLNGESGQEISSSSIFPEEFFEDMECSWKGRVRRLHAVKAYSDVDIAARSVIKAVSEDFLPVISRIKSVVSSNGNPKGEICYAREHGAIWFKGKRFMPLVWSDTPGEEQIKQLRVATDSKGRKVGEEWFTTFKVDNALCSYREACDKAKIVIVEILKELSGTLQASVNALVFCSTLLIIARALASHVSEARRRHWVTPTIHEFSNHEENEPMEIVGLSPYWFDSIQCSSVKNTVQMESLFLLTGPNGGGKSSLLRSICATALLGICGLMVPAESAIIPHFDSIMLHMKSYDSPADGKSSFQMEMSELRALITGATSKSLVLVDEICRGTEAGKGACIAGSIIESLDKLGCLGVVSTHLPQIFELPINVKRVVKKAMGTQNIRGKIEPTWKLSDGICKESLAFETARDEGIPESVIRRAEELYASGNLEASMKVDYDVGLQKFNPVLGIPDKCINPVSELLTEVENVVKTISEWKLNELYKQKKVAARTVVSCRWVGAREYPPPSVVGVSSVYVIFRPDMRLYVGQTDDLMGRLCAHRSKDEMQHVSLLYLLVPGKSIAAELEALLINELSGKGFPVVNKIDGQHRNFGSSYLFLDAVVSPFC